MILVGIHESVNGCGCSVVKVLIFHRERPSLKPNDVISFFGTNLYWGTFANKIPLTITKLVN